LKTFFGGAFEKETKTYSSRTGFRATQTIWKWEIRDRQAANFVKHALPFLKIKRRQAKLLLRLRKSKDFWWHQGAYGGSRGIPRRILEYRESLHSRVKGLNQEDQNARYNPSSNTLILPLASKSMKREVHNSTTLAYLGGLADAEGYFGIRKGTWHMRHGLARAPAYHEDVQIRMSDPSALRLLKALFDGALRREPRIYSSRSGFESRARCWVWEVKDRQAVNFVKCVMPFLRIKKRQAQFLLELRKSKDFWRRQGGWRGHYGGSRSVPTHVLSYRERLYCGAKRLNSGPSKKQMI
jgi:hypothetical protein